MRRIALIIFSLLSALCVLAQTNARRLVREPVFQDGEKATYNLYFNLGFIWMHAGDVKFDCTVVKKNGRDCYRLSVNGYTQGTFERFYVVRDTFVSYLDKETLLPVYYEDFKHEDKYYSHTTYSYTEEDDSLHVVYHRDKKNKTIDKEYMISKAVCDLITCCYNTRNTDVDALVREQSVPLHLMYEDELYNLGLKYKGKKNIKTKSGVKYRTIYFMPQVILGGLFKNEDDLVVYVADDESRVPVYVEAKLKMGYAVASLAKIEGTKHPITSIIKK